MKKGFTLVELAIVLVIIGLIAGGILAAMSMIQTARIQAQLRQFQQFDVATSNFKLRYNQLPGDCGICDITGGPPGNNNGILDGANFTPEDSVWQEPYFYFIELHKLGNLKDNYDYNSYDNLIGINHQFPSAAIGRGGVIVSGNNFGDVFYAFITIGNQQGLSDYNALMPKGDLSPTEALAIDKKIDDALPGSGNVAATTNAREVPTSFYPLILDNAAGGCVNSGRYNVGRSDKDLCRIVVKSDAAK